MLKGKFAARLRRGFKLEAAIELISDLDVVIPCPRPISKESLKRQPDPGSDLRRNREKNLQVYSGVAFNTAYALLDERQITRFRKNRVPAP